ncbi:MAG: tetratricopeptide repeat protein [Bacteroidota bacterium]
MHSLFSQILSAEAVLKLQNDTNKINELNRISADYLKSQKADSSLYFNQKSIELCMQGKRFDKMVDAYSDRQKIYSNSGDEINAFNSLQLSLNKCREIKYRLGVSNTCRNIAIYYFGLGKYQTAIRYANWGLANGDSITEPVRYMSLLNNIGTCNSNLGNYNEASAYLLRALRIAEMVHDTFRVAAICNNVSQLYNRIGDVGKAKEYVFKSIGYLSKYDSISLKNPYTNIAYIYLESEAKYDSALYYYKKAALLSEASGDNNLLTKTYLNIASAYKKKGVIDSASNYVEKALSSAYKINNNQGISGALNMMAVDLMQKGKTTGNKSYFTQALVYMKQSLQNAELSENTEIKQTVYENLAFLYNEMGDYKNAYLYNVKFKNIKDSTLNTEIINNTAKLEARYLAEKSEKEIAENKIQLQQRDIEITKKTADNNLLLSGVAVLVILLLFGSITFIQRQKLAQRQKEFEKHKAIEQTRAAIAGDLHDDIGSTLSSVQFMSSFAMQAIDNSSPDARQWVQKIESNTGDLLQNIRDIVWTLNPENDNAADIILRMKHFASQILEPKNINFTFHVSEEAEKYLDTLIAKRNVFLIYKEVLNNAAKYAQTTAVSVSLVMEGEQMKMTVADIGKGFDPMTLTSGSGLKNIKKRAEHLKGKLIINSSEHSGTTVELLC